MNDKVEHGALQVGLSLTHNMRAKVLIVCSDSQLVVR